MEIKNKNATVTVKDEYAPFIWDKENSKWFMLFQQRSERLDWCKANLADYRKNWETHHPEFDFNKIEIRHRTVISTVTEWENV